MNDKAKVLKGLLDSAVRNFARERGLRQDAVKLPWVQGAVLLHSPTVRFEIASEDRTSAYGLLGSAGLPSIRTLLTAVPRNKDDAMTANRTKALSLMLDRIGMTRRRKRRVGPDLLELNVFDEGPGYQDFLLYDPRPVRRWLADWSKPAPLRGHGSRQHHAHGNPCLFVG